MSSPACFLTLPPEIQLKIFTFADLVQEWPINLNKGWSKTRGGICQRNLSTRPPACTKHREVCSLINPAIRPVPTQLFRVCRAMRDTAMEVLYNQNKFTIFLDVEFALSPQAVGKMTSICVRLSGTCSCDCYVTPSHRKSCEACRSQFEAVDGSQLSAEMMETKVVERWYGLCKVLERNARPGLWLALIFDCEENLEVAQKILRPMQKLPKLANCSIRLGPIPDSALRQLAKDTVIKLTGRKSASPRNSFSFASLPIEIQRQILSYTDLVAPATFVWSPMARPEWTYKTYWQKRILFKKDEWHCQQCTDHGEACCCDVNHAAFSSSHCLCWHFPAALFLVNKVIKHLSTEIFLSRNQFLIFELTLWPRRSGGYPEELMLKMVPAYGFKYLRLLSVQLDCFHNTHLSYEPNYFYEIWQKWADFVSQNLDTSKLTLELKFLNLSRSVSLMEQDERSPLMNKAKVFKFPIPLKDFFVRIHSRWPPAIDPVRLRWEQDLERLVMGPSYDAESRGKCFDRGFYLGK